MNAHNSLRTLLLAALAVGACGCDEIVSALGLETGARQLSDSDAFTHLRSNYQAAPKTDLNSVRAVIDEQVDQKIAKKGRRKASEQSEEVIDLKRSLIHARKTIDTSSFSMIPAEEISAWRESQQGKKATCSNPYSIDKSKLKSSDYLIPNADKIPVRDQGGRGTCAAFAGTGTVEYAALNGPSAGLPTLDLSEQRFYYISKPECQKTGCVRSQSEGSWYGSGFDESAAASSLDIPLETDCPYVSAASDNDLQVPQKNSCGNGSAKVQSNGVEYWCGFDGLVDLLNRGYAVPFGSILTDNWYNSNGVITKSGIGNGELDRHAGGHAYLIVGYRTKGIPDSEGGVCFMVKNSWGTGWGVNGYACQTLEWMKAADKSSNGFGLLGTSNPIVTGVDVAASLKGKELPEDNKDTEEEVSTDVTPDNGSDDGLPPIEEDVEPPKTVPEESDYSDVNLLGSTEKYLRAQSAELDGKLFIRGELLKDAGYTTAVVVDKKGKKLYYDGDEVGKVTSDAITLCAGEWAHLCSLRYKESSKKMYIQFRDDDLRNVKPEETTADKGEWYDVDFGTGAYGVFVPKAEDALVDLLLDPKVYVKLGTSEASRLSLRATAWNKLDIRLQGEAVGELNLTSPMDSSLCSGNFAKTCEIIGRDRLHIFPSNEK